MQIQVHQIPVKGLVESVSRARWADTVGFDWTWPLDPRTKACWATPVQSE